MTRWSVGASDIAGVVAGRALGADLAGEHQGADPEIDQTAANAARPTSDSMGEQEP